MVHTHNSIDKIAIIILNYKNYDETINCIESIYGTRNEGYTIFVVDNSSGNNSLAEIETAFQHKKDITYYSVLKTSIEADMVLIDNKVNSGYAAGNNVGLRIAYNLGYKYLMVLNNDTLFSNDCLSTLKNALIAQDNTLCVGPKLLKADGSLDFNCAKRRPKLTDFFLLSGLGRRLRNRDWYEHYYYLKGDPNIVDLKKVDIISGSCMLFRSSLFADIDFFDERTFLYFEEAIVTEKARKKGYDIYLEPKAEIIHLGAASTKKNTVSNFALKCEYNSAIYYLTKYRGLSRASAEMVCLGQRLFLPIKRLKKRK